LQAAEARVPDVHTGGQVVEGHHAAGAGPAQRHEVCHPDRHARDPAGLQHFTREDTEMPGGGWGLRLTGQVFNAILL